VPNRRDVLGLLAWLLPAAYFVVFGVAKLIAPEGTPPRALVGLLDVAPWSAWLRGMGALELAVGLLLVVPRTRPVGRPVAFALVAALTALLALNAEDVKFVADCGCMGALRPSGRGPTEVDLLLVRNAVVLFVIAFGAYLARPAASVGGALGTAGAVAGVVLLAALFAAEKAKSADARDALSAGEAGRSLAAKLGWPLPNLAVKDERGATLGLKDATQPGDHVLVLSTTCPHCAASGPGVQALARRLAGARTSAATAGGDEGPERVLLLVIEEGGPSAAEWLPKNGFGGLPYLRLPRQRDARRLGLDGVPGWIVLDAEGRVAAHEDHGGRASLLDDMAAAGPLADELSTVLWARLARETAGPDVAVGPPQRGPHGGWYAELGTPPGSAGRLFVRAQGQQRAHAVELAVSVSNDGRILGATLLASGSHAGWTAPDLRADVEALRGLTVPEAMRRATERFREDGPGSPEWRAVYMVLEKLPGARTPAGH
jgi:hypothetical protein